MQAQTAFSKILNRVYTHTCSYGMCGTSYHVKDLSGARGRAGGCPECGNPVVKISPNTRNNMALSVWLKEQVQMGLVPDVKCESAFPTSYEVNPDIVSSFKAVSVQVKRASGLQ